MEETRRILVVDDENLILKIISDILVKEGYEVKTAFNCGKALQRLKESSFHVVLSDIRMPEKNGIDLLAEIRKFNPDLPVILMTGFASLVTAVEAVHHGAFDYLTKPLDYDKLKSIIRHAVEKYDLFRENKHLVAELKELNESLELKVRERNRELENILNSTHESIMTTDRELVIKTANPRTRDMFGDDCVGRKLSELVQGINFDSIIPRILSDSSSTTKHELRYKDKFLEITISSLIDFQTNELFGTIAITEDITEKKKLEAQLIQSTKMSAVGQLAAGIAHEFNNILTGIMGYTGFAMSRMNIEQIRNDLKIVEKASNRAVEIVNKLLSFSRQKDEKFQLVSIDEVIEDTLVLIEHTFQSDGIKIIRHYGKVPPIRMNVGEIQQVILNMAINSRHAMPEGGVIGISTELKDDYAKIDFSDTGIGISRENMSRIFEPFFSTKGKAGSKSGTGLGLSVVYAIIERHGGRIDVSSEVGKGTTFTILLPNVQRLMNPAKINYEISEDDGQILQTKRKGSILVVDDEEFVCDIIKESLSSVGHNIVVAGSGETATGLLGKNHFDIVFLNLGLPGKSGFDVLKEMKILAPNSFVVIISGKAEEELTDGIGAECSFSFITKPFTVNQIKNTVARILGAV